MWYREEEILSNGNFHRYVYCFLQENEDICNAKEKAAWQERLLHTTQCHRLERTDSSLSPGFNLAQVDLNHQLPKCCFCSSCSHDLMPGMHKACSVWTCKNFSFLFFFFLHIILKRFQMIWMVKKCSFWICQVSYMFIIKSFYNSNSAHNLFFTRGLQRITHSISDLCPKF